TEHATNNSSSKSSNSAQQTSSPNPATAAALTQVRDLMWRHVGIMRNGKDLAAAIALLEKLPASRSPLPAEFLDSPHPTRHDCELPRTACKRVPSRSSVPCAGFARGSCFVITSRPAHPLLHSVKLLQSTGSIVVKLPWLAAHLTTRR